MTRSSILVPGAALGCRADDNRAARRDEGLVGLRVLLERGVLRHVIAQHLEEAIEFALHLSHFLAHIEDDLDASQIHAKVARQIQNHFQTFDVLVGVKAHVAIGS